MILTRLKGEGNIKELCISHICDLFLAHGLEALLAATRICNYQVDVSLSAFSNRRKALEGRISLISIAGASFMVLDMWQVLSEYSPNELNASAE